MYMYEFDNAIAVKRKSISLFWYLDNFLEKEKTGLPFQMNFTWYLLINWWGLHLFHVWAIQLLSSLNVKVYFISSDLILFFLFVDIYVG